MLAAIRSAAVLGIDAYDVTVEVDAAQGLPQWTIVGLPAGAVKESRERVGAALVNSGFVVPPRRMTMNLAPADVRKDGTAFDLPDRARHPRRDGAAARRVRGIDRRGGRTRARRSLRAMRGALPVARRVSRAPAAARSCFLRRMWLRRRSCARRRSLRRARLAISSPRCAQRARTCRRRAPDAPRHRADPLDFADVVGQGTAKRALEIAAAGGHNVVMVGPPGRGEDDARAAAAEHPAGADRDEALEVTAIHSVAGVLAPARPLV